MLNIFTYYASVWDAHFAQFPAEVFFYVGLVHYSWDPQVPSFCNFFFKTESHETVHTFKNYFATMFLVFSFQ